MLDTRSAPHRGRFAFGLLPVRFQNLQAGLAQLGAVLLQAAQDTQAVRHLVEAEFGRVRPAGRFFLRRAPEHAAGTAGHLALVGLRQSDAVRQK
jgi:hypothetical protein